MKEDERIHLLAKRGKAVKQRRWKPDVQKKISSKRQIVETAFSCITNLLPRALIVRTQQGFWVAFRVYGAATAKGNILIVQALPALIALVLIWYKYL